MFLELGNIWYDLEPGETKYVEPLGGPMGTIKTAHCDFYNMCGQFVIKKTKNDGYCFNLLANNREVVCTSQTYASKANAKAGIESIRRNADAEIEDQTLVKSEPKKCPKWEVYRDKADEFRFRLKASNGEIILQSQGYTAKSSAKNGIDSIRRNKDSEVVEEDE